MEGVSFWTGTDFLTKGPEIVETASDKVCKKFISISLFHSILAQTGPRWILPDRVQV